MAAIDLRRFGRIKPGHNGRSQLDEFVAGAYKDSTEPAPDLIRVIKAYLDTQKKRTAA